MVALNMEKSIISQNKVSFKTKIGLILDFSFLTAEKE
jgi:hypothetical protein